MLVRAWQCSLAGISAGRCQVSFVPSAISGVGAEMEWASLCS